MAVFLSGIVTNAQNSEEAKRVLRLSREKCMSIQQGHYEVEHWKKFMMDKDTTITRNTCDFRKLPEDTIYGKAFNRTIESIRMTTGMSMSSIQDTNMSGFLIPQRLFSRATNGPTKLSQDDTITTSTNP